MAFGEPWEACHWCLDLTIYAGCSHEAPVQATIRLLSIYKSPLFATSLVSFVCYPYQTTLSYTKNIIHYSLRLFCLDGQIPSDHEVIRSLKHTYIDYTFRAFTIRQSCVSVSPSDIQSADACTIVTASTHAGPMDNVGIRSRTRQSWWDTRVRDTH